MNSEIAKTVIDRFPQMLEAAAVLLQAADGAGLPMRPPMAIVESDQDEEKTTKRTRRRRRRTAVSTSTRSSPSSCRCSSPGSDPAR